MPTIREGGAVEVELPGARPSFPITVNENKWVQVHREILEDLGFRHEEGVNASREFAERLYKLSKKLDARSPKDPDQPDYDEALEQSLNLKSDKGKVISRRVLKDLIKISAPLRSRLSRNMVKALTRLRYLSDAPDPRLDEPSLTFQSGPNAWAPILWDMMYELKQVDPVDWREFWGFRIPITYWINVNRTPIIPLHSKKRALWAINDDLVFAEQEVSALTPRLEHESLVAILRRQVLNELPSYLSGQDPESWLQADHAEGKGWLSRYFELRWPDDDVREDEGATWKEVALKKVLGNRKRRYDVVHFACHCRPSDRSAFLSELDMTVGGEPVSLEAGFIESDLKLVEDDDQWGLDDPGPLVFLNACSTGKDKSPGYEMPGFPETWIKAQGALAVIATLCPVPDYFAHAFAQKFYEILFESKPPRNRYLGEALLATRRYFMEQYNNPLGLAYVLYAFSNARIDMDSRQGTVP